jgi:hypothetical protein
VTAGHAITTLRRLHRRQLRAFVIEPMLFGKWFESGG